MNVEVLDVTVPFFGEKECFCEDILYIGGFV